MSVVLSLVMLMVPAFAQPQTSNQAAEVSKAIHKLDVLNQVLPLVMTKEQLNKILTDLEKVREINKNIEKMEADELQAVKAKVDAEVKRSIESNDLPSDEIMNELTTLFEQFTARRAVQTGRNVAAMNESMLQHLNEGQISAAANSVNPKYFDPRIDMEEVTEGQKLYMWIERVLLDPVTYEVLIELSQQ